MAFLINIFNKVRSRHDRLRVKKKVLFEGLEIRLYKIDFSTDDIQLCLEIFDKNGQVIRSIYNTEIRCWDMQIDEENKLLEIDNGASRFYLIDLPHGHIINSEFRK